MMYAIAWYLVNGGSRILCVCVCTEWLVEYVYYGEGTLANVLDIQQGKFAYIY